MDDRFFALRQKLESSVLTGKGESAPDLRQKVAANSGVPGDLAAFVDKIHKHAYKVTDEEVAALRQKYSDDYLFEVIAAAAFGAARMRLDAALKALAGSEAEVKHAAAKG